MAQQGKRGEGVSLTNLLQATRLCLCPKRSRSVTCAKRSEAARKESEANASEGEVTAVATQRKRLPANATPAEEGMHVWHSIVCTHPDRYANLAVSVSTEDIQIMAYTVSEPKKLTADVYNDIGDEAVPALRRGKDAPRVE